MQSEGMIALSGVTTSIAIAGAVSALRGAAEKETRVYLVAVYLLAAGLAALPLVVAFARRLYVFYMPGLLPMLLALAPAVYLYVKARAATAPAAHNSVVHWRHGVLPAAGLLVAVGYWLLPAAARAMILVDGRAPPGLAPTLIIAATFSLLLIWSLASFAYLIVTLRHLGVFRKRLKDLYSNTETRELRWIDWLMGGLAALWGAAAAVFFSDNLGPGLPFPEEVVLVLMAALLLFVMAFSSLSPPADEPQEQPDLQTDQAPPEALPKYARSALTPELAGRIAARIEAAMRDEALYLNPDLSLQKLSQHVGARANLVSQTLNEQLGATFFDYIAHWRIEAAKPLILEGKASITAVALEVGFNSRSSFYKAFKKQTGLTPKAFGEAQDA